MQDETAIIHDLMVMGTRCGKHDEVWAMLTSSLENDMTVADAATVIISWLYSLNKLSEARTQPTVQAIPAPRWIKL